MSRSRTAENLPRKPQEDEERERIVRQRLSWRIHGRNSSTKGLVGGFTADNRPRKPWSEDLRPKLARKSLGRKIYGQNSSTKDSIGGFAAEIHPQKPWSENLRPKVVHEGLYWRMPPATTAPLCIPPAARSPTRGRCSSWMRSRRLLPRCRRCAISTRTSRICRSSRPGL